MRQDAAKGLVKVIVPDAEIQSLLSRDPLVLTSQDHVRKWKDFIADFREKSVKGDADPMLQKHLKSLADAEWPWRNSKKTWFRKPPKPGAWPNSAAAAEASRQSETKVAMLTAAAKSLREQVDALQKKMQTLNENNVQLDRISDSTTPLEGLVKTLSEQEAKLRYEIEANPIRFDVIEDATVLNAADDKRRLLAPQSLRRCLRVRCSWPSPSTSSAPERLIRSMKSSTT